MLIDLFGKKKEKEIASSTYVSYGMLDYHEYFKSIC
jgi:hypothetical protein